MIAVEVSKEDSHIFNELRKCNAPDILFDTTFKSFDGFSELAQCIVALSTTTLPFITKIVIEQLRSKKYVSLIVDGIKIDGVSEDSLPEILERVMKSRNK